MVLICSSNDDQTTNLVIAWLNYYGVNWIRLNETDKFKILNIDINAQGIDLKFQINESKWYKLRDLTGYWYRRGSFNIAENLFEICSNYLRVNIHSFIELQLKELVAFIEAVFKEKLITVGSFQTAINRKLFYLEIARKVGLAIPDTLITTNLISVHNFATISKSIITKDINEGLLLQTKTETLYSKIDVIKPHKLSEPPSFLPTLFQKNISKFIEIRVYFCYGKLYPMAIFSQNNVKTKLDFREYDYQKPNRNIPFQFNRDTYLKIKKFVKQSGLTDGSIDIILGKDNLYYFLEVNPVGQFGMVSYPCNYYLEEKLAKQFKN